MHWKIAKKCTENAKNALMYHFGGQSWNNAMQILASLKNALTFSIIKIIWCFKRENKAEYAGYRTSIVESWGSLSYNYCPYVIINISFSPDLIDDKFMFLSRFDYKLIFILLLFAFHTQTANPGTHSDIPLKIGIDKGIKRYDLAKSFIGFLHNNR